jgi:methyl-accepting chemotaxis protein
MSAYNSLFCNLEIPIQAEPGHFDHIRGLGAGTYERMSDDGVNRLFAYKRLSLKENSTPHLLIAVGITKDRIIHKGNVAMLHYLLLLTLATFGAMSLAGLLGYSSLVRPKNHLVSGARRLGSGEMDSRTDLPHTHDELGMLSKSFDDMAEMLERRNIETQIAVSALRETEERYQTLSEATFEGVAFTEKGLLIDANS